MQMVRQELQTKLGEKVNDLSGVKIFTTLDPVSQDAAEKAVETASRCAPRVTCRIWKRRW